MQSHDTTSPDSCPLSPKEQARREKRHAIQAKYRAAHKAEIQAQAAQYRESHREEIRQKGREYYVECGDEIRQRAREAYWTHPEKGQARRDAMREQTRAYNRTYAITHRDEANARAKTWYYANHSRAIATRKQWYRANRDAVLGQHKAKRVANVEEYRAKDRARWPQKQVTNLEWLRRHPEQNRARVKAWRETNPERYRLAHLEIQNRRRARKRGATIEHVDLAVVIARDKGLCGICGKKVKATDISIDHILPLSQGGAHAMYNVQLAHRRCNTLKGAGRLPSQLRLPF